MPMRVWPIPASGTAEWLSRCASRWPTSAVNARPLAASWRPTTTRSASTRLPRSSSTVPWRSQEPSVDTSKPSPFMLKDPTSTRTRRRRRGVVGDDADDARGRGVAGSSPKSMRPVAPDSGRRDAKDWRLCSSSSSSMASCTSSDDGRFAGSSSRHRQARSAAVRAVGAAATAASRRAIVAAAPGPACDTRSFAPARSPSMAGRPVSTSRSTTPNAKTSVDGATRPVLAKAGQM
mmetsp:Transcript_8929/g.30615  ORF Transcript_8929/g.30615 Transcript_8929/m.30615 type:complete len:234 (+) Transcript_8929:741-1442(+)